MFWRKLNWVFNTNFDTKLQAMLLPKLTPDIFFSQPFSPWPILLRLTLSWPILPWSLSLQPIPPIYSLSIHSPPSPKPSSYSMSTTLVVLHFHSLLPRQLVETKNDTHYFLLHHYLNPNEPSSSSNSFDCRRVVRPERLERDISAETARGRFAQGVSTSLISLSICSSCLIVPSSLIFFFCLSTYPFFLLSCWVWEEELETSESPGLRVYSRAKLSQACWDSQQWPFAPSFLRQSPPKEALVGPTERYLWVVPWWGYREPVSSPQSSQRKLNPSQQVVMLGLGLETEVIKWDLER